MFYHLFYPLKSFFFPFNIFYYITFRSICAIITSLILSFILGSWMIKHLKNKGYIQTIRDDGPPTHKRKSGTPTMGGLMVLIVCFLSIILWARLDNRFILWILVCILWLGVLGWLDDYLKIIKKQTKGLRAKWKLLGQFIFTSSVALYLFYFPQNKEYITKINIPYLKETCLDVGIFYLLFVILLIVASSNAVNLTDGLDGLAIGCIIISAATYSIFAYIAGNIKIAEYLKIIYVAGSGELTVFLASLIGAGLGFLWFNSYPAEVFLGDTGSLFLGGCLGLVAVFIKQELILIVVGGIFVVEAMSVVLQVFSYKKYKRRIFKMAPLHHHYEMLGFAEPKITLRFWIVNIILALVALSSLKIR